MFQNFESFQDLSLCAINFLFEEGNSLWRHPRRAFMVLTTRNIQGTHRHYCSCQWVNQFLSLNYVFFIGPKKYLSFHLLSNTSLPNFEKFLWHNQTSFSFGFTEAKQIIFGLHRKWQCFFLEDKKINMLSFGFFFSWLRAATGVFSA